MNREIKFRVWDDLNKQWMLGYDRKNLGGFSMIGEVMIFGEYKRMLDSFSIKDLDKLKIMQFTGLHDKNGKGIYEGDICKVYNFDEPNIDTYDVAYDRGSFVFINCLTLAIELRGYKTDYIEIIGNIYENSELLT